jgi:hypothetical protein
MQFPSQKLLLLLTPRLPRCITSAVREDVAADVKLLAIVLDMETRGASEGPRDISPSPCLVR